MSLSLPLSPRIATLANQTAYQQQVVVAPSLTPDCYTLTSAKPAPRLAERGISFV